MASGPQCCGWEGVTGLPAVLGPRGGQEEGGVCLLEDVALVGSQTHEAKDEHEQPHQTRLPPASPSSQALWAMLESCWLGAVLGPEPEPLGLETTECR